MRQVINMVAILALLATLTSCGESTDLPMANDDCAGAYDLEFICDLISPEDVVAIPYSNLVVVSGYQQGHNGGIHYVSTQDYSHTQVFPTANPRIRQNMETFGACPGPIDTVSEGDDFSAHGLNIKQVEEGLYWLYVVHHGLRESIEIFEIDSRYQGAVSTSSVPGFTWVGCVIAPESHSLNSVSPLPNGGFVVTVPFAPVESGEQVDISGGAVQGIVWEWNPTDGWIMIPGSESPGPNGIEASRDGEWLYVNLWASNQVMRLSRGRAPVEKTVVDLTFHPDNIRWQDDGSLLTAGHGAESLPRILECLEVLCDDMTSQVARVNPDTLEVERIINIPANEHFFTATAALQVNNEIWVGSMRGDRVARYGLP